MLRCCKYWGGYCTEARDCIIKCPGVLLLLLLLLLLILPLLLLLLLLLPAGPPHKAPPWSRRCGHPDSPGLPRSRCPGGGGGGLSFSSRGPGRREPAKKFTQARPYELC